MIQEVDAALESLLKATLGDDVAVSFEPTGEAAKAASQRKHGLVDLHLLDVSEDSDEMHTGYARAYAADGTMVRTAAPRWFRLSYWLTAWGADAAREHALLGTALSALATHDAFPRESLSGSLAEADRPVRLAVAMPAAGEAFAATVWSSLAVPMKGALHVVVRAPVGPPPGIAAAKPVTDRDLRITGPPPPREPTMSTPPGVPPALAAPPAPGSPAPSAAVPPAETAEPRPESVEVLRYGPERHAPPETVEEKPETRAPSGA